MNRHRQLRVRNRAKHNRSIMFARHKFVPVPFQLYPHQEEALRQLRQLRQLKCYALTCP